MVVAGGSGSGVKVARCEEDKRLAMVQSNCSLRAGCARARRSPAWFKLALQRGGVE